MITPIDGYDGNVYGPEQWPEDDPYYIDELDDKEEPDLSQHPVLTYP